MNKCIINECDRKSVSRKMCYRHYQNLTKYGNPIPRRERTLKVIIEEIGWKITKKGCWEWNGRKNWSGYGMIEIRRLGIKDQRAHRIVFEHLTGIKIGKKILMHTCDNPPCVNPKHLLIGTQLENIADMNKKERHWCYNRTKCPNGHNLTIEGATKVIKRKNRTDENACVKCDRERKKRWELKQKVGSPMRN